MAVDERLTGNLTVDGSITQAGVALQPTLVSGTNIKTINGSSVLGSGDLVVSGGGGGIHALVQPTMGQVVAPVITALAASAGFATTNRLTAVPFIPANNFTCSNLFLNVTSASAGANARILIYSNLNGIPNTKLYESANLDCSTTGIKTAITTFNFVAGTTYWICSHTTIGNGFTFFSVGSVLGFQTNSTVVGTSYIYTFAFGSAPTTLSGQTLSNAATLAVYITSA